MENIIKILKQAQADAIQSKGGEVDWTEDALKRYRKVDKAVRGMDLAIMMLREEQLKRKA